MTQLTSDPSAEWCPDWSPDGSTLAFYAHRTGNREIFTMPAVGGEWRQITDNPGPDLHPSWSHDGGMLAFLTNRREGNGAWLTRLDGSGGQLVTSASNGMRWSPVDRRYAFARDGQLWVGDADSEAPPRSVATAGFRSPRWTPDGGSILFHGDRSISMIDARGGRPARSIVELAGRPGELGFYGTPTDGRHVYFVWIEDVGDIWVMDVARTP